jgi:hypothetical protein
MWAGCGVAWAVVILLLVMLDADRLRLFIVVVAVAVCTVIVAAVFAVARPPSEAYRLGYRVGWDEGRTAERSLRGVRPDRRVVPIRARSDRM